MASTTSTNSSRWSALQDLVLVLGALLISKYLLLQIETIWTYAGPISLLFALCVAAICLRQRRISWASIGLNRPKRFKLLLLWTVVALIATLGVDVLIQSLGANFFGAPDEATQTIDARFQGRFDNLPGNFPVFLFWLAIGWIIGGFTEEVLFRGILFSRFEHLFTNVPFAALFAIACQAFLFGQGHHYYQGMAGWVANSAIGVMSGVLYLVFKRNLWPLMISHGLTNTIGITLLYLGVMQ